MKRKKIFYPLMVISAVLIAGAGFFGFSARNGAVPAGYDRVKIIRGDIEETVSSSGRLQAVGTVNVLTQLTGTVEKVHVDFNDPVKKGQPLVELNTEMLKISLREARAALHKAKAQNEHDILTYTNNQKLAGRNLLSEFDLHASRTALEVSKANLMQAEAQYERARLNIDEYAIILSPINGIVLDRNVEKGQTVAANSGSMTQLFTLAENLKIMEISAEVDELDISKIREGMDVRFSVEAYPDKKFRGKVRQVRIVPTASNNVVNYTVIVTAENEEGFLLPGMTATTEFLVMEKKDVLLVPTAAFRFSPPEDVASAARRKMLEERLKDRPAEERAAALKQFDEARKSAKTASGTGTGSGSGQSALLGGMPRFPGAGGGARPAQGAGGEGAGTGPQDNRKTLWLYGSDGSLTPRMVGIGVADGKNTEIRGPSDLEGRDIVLRQKK
jgi:HlyD family secretion protein